MKPVNRLDYERLQRDALACIVVNATDMVGGAPADAATSELAARTRARRELGSALVAGIGRALRTLFTRADRGGAINAPFGVGGMDGRRVRPHNH